MLLERNGKLTMWKSIIPKYDAMQCFTKNELAAKSMSIYSVSQPVILLKSSITTHHFINRVHIMEPDLEVPGKLPRKQIRQNLSGRSW